MRRASVHSALAIVAILGAASVARARCAPIALPQEVRQSAYVVEAVLVEAGDTATFRTIQIYKGGPSAPSRFTLGARQGRGHWPWHESSNVGQPYILLLQRNGDGYTVYRCGSSGPANDATRRELEGQGLHPQAPPPMP